MKGDFSRIRFEPGKHYTDVLDQQGRIAYDADHNEQRLIDGHRRTVETIDVIGDYGAPMHDAGFKINVVGSTLSIGAGRYYVHGLLCENAKALDYDEQPFLIQGSGSTDIGEVLTEMRRSRRGCLRVYLEVWQRMVTALDDSCLGEPALGQADTTVRLQTVWRVVATHDAGAFNDLGAAKKSKKLKYMEKSARATSILDWSDMGTLKHDAAAVRASSPCSCRAMYAEKPPKHTGTLNAQIVDSSGNCGCQPIPTAGYTGQENQLYRIEIQRSGTLATATMKWSRENGSVLVAVLAVSGSKVTVSSLGMDANLGFQENQWVEIGDDTDAFGLVPNQPGRLYQIQHIDRPSMTVTMTTTVQSVDTTRHARMRRWDQSGSAATADGVRLSDGWIDIENGIQVQFGKGHYAAGDAWTVPARSATGQIDWPPCGGDGHPFQPPFHAPVHRAPLACIQFDEKGLRHEKAALDEAIRHEFYSPWHIDDCRRLFPSLTDLSGFIGATALHITRINWKNDDAMTFDALLSRGLIATFDTVPTGPLSPANFIVTMEIPMGLDTARYASAATLHAEDSSADAQPPVADAADIVATTTKDWISPWTSDLRMPTVIRTPFIIDSTVTRHGKTIAWTLPSKDVNARQRIELETINAVLGPWARRGSPVRVRVKLPGHALYASHGGKSLYLDGQAFGQSARRRDEARERSDLIMPTGSDRRASDFESWFYLYPALAVENVAFTYDQLTLDDSAAIVGSDPAATSEHIVQRATIELNYAALDNTTIQLSMSGDADVASVPAQVAVKPGDTQASVEVTIHGPPEAPDQPLRFVLSASLPSAMGEATSQTASFTVRGLPPPDPSEPVIK